MYKTNDYGNMDVIDCYNLIMAGKMKSFPYKFMDKERSKRLLRYIIFKDIGITEHKIAYDEESKVKLKKYLCEILMWRFLRSNKITVIYSVFCHDIDELFRYCFPEIELYAFELLKTPNNYWDSDDARLKALLWMARKENLNLDDISQVRKFKFYSSKYFIMIKGATKKNGKFDIWNLLGLYYMDKYKPWKVLIRVHEWDFETAIYSIHWLIEEKLKFDRNMVCQNICHEMFEKYGLDSMLRSIFNSSIFAALSAAYPELNYTKSEFRAKKSSNML